MYWSAPNLVYSFILCDCDFLIKFPYLPFLTINTRHCKKKLHENSVYFY